MKQQTVLSDDHRSYILSADAQLFTQAVQQGFLTTELVDCFKQHIMIYFKRFGRSFSWRQTTDPYHIMVSEIMLQQTQTFRVAGKFEHFIEQFADFKTLAQASTRDVIAAWQGLGYNRRALALQGVAQRVMQEFDGILPDDPNVLETFKGIGKNTAGSICAFAFNKPTIFIETNIRSVYIHFFFQSEAEVHDKLLLPLIQQTIDYDNPRQWYYALMDYGVVLKKLFPNPSRKSRHYTKQSKFEGSDRQIRGAILKLLLDNPCIDKSFLSELFKTDKHRIIAIVQDLSEDGFIEVKNDIIMLA